MLQYIKYFLSNPTMHALLWTLIHSLWQGILFAIITAIVLYQTKNSNVHSRYKLLCGIFSAFLITSFCTFFYELNLLFQSNNITATTDNLITAINTIPVQYNTNTKDKLLQSLQSSEYIIVLFYLLIVLIKCVNVVNGFRTVYRLKHRQVFNAGNYWNEKLSELSTKINLTKPVRLLQSAIIKVPMVVGYIKPVILFPASAITTLPQAEIEAILLHELAHIKRKDYVVNMLQNFAEIIYFFNPAVLWISSLIKEERENCCDDIAINHTHNKKQFIQALIAFQEHHLSTSYAASFAGKKYQLSNRVKRIITNNNKTLNNMEKILLAAGIIVTGLVAAVIPQNKQLHLNQSSNIIQSIKPIAVINKRDSIPQENKINKELKSVIQSTINGKEYKLVEVDGKVSELYENNTKIESSKLSNYDSVIDKLHEGINAQKDLQDAQEKAMKAQSEILEKQAEVMKPQTLLIQKNVEKLAEENVKQAEALNKKQIAGIQQQAKLAQADVIKNNKALVQLETLQNSDQLKALADHTEALKESQVLAEIQSAKAEEQINHAEENLKLKMDFLKDNQDLLLTDKGKAMNEEMQKQIKDLKKQQDDLMKQNKALRDSVNQIKINKPSGAVKHSQSDVVVR